MIVKHKASTTTVSGITGNQVGLVSISRQGCLNQCVPILGILYLYFRQILVYLTVSAYVTLFMITLEPLSMWDLENKKQPSYRTAETLIIFEICEVLCLSTYSKNFYSILSGFPDVYIPRTGATDKVTVPYS